MICKTCNNDFEQRHNTQRYCSDSCTPYKNKYMAWDTWRSMHKRCKDPKTNQYENYGGKGISVCPSWNNYHTFITDMGLKPDLTFQIDRIDSYGNYEPSNCRWVSAKDNIRNKKNYKTVTWDNITKSVAEWAEQMGFARSTFVSRLKKLGVEGAMTTPRHPTGPKRD